MQPSLFSRLPLSDGPGLEPADQKRLAAHLVKVRDLMASGAWMTLDYIAESVECSQAGASARLRDLRKLKHGAHTITRKRASEGVWLYRMEK